MGVVAALTLVLTMGAFFFLFIPGMGAFYARSRWRRFRRRMIDSSLLPIAGYREITETESGRLGYFRFLGHLEAIQGDDYIWLRSGNLSVSAELRRVSVYTLPSMTHVDREGRVERNEETVIDEMPRRIPWNRITSLPSGTQVLVTGALYSIDGQQIFRSERKAPLVVVIYDGGEDTLMRRSIWAGRQRNEYWNQFTPISLIAGILSLLFLAYNFFPQPLLRFPAVLALVLSFSPITPFLPPGLLLFFAYRSLWRRGRFDRAERDILQLPLRYFSNDLLDTEMRSQLPNGEIYTAKAYHDWIHALETMKGGKIRTTSILDSSNRDTGAYYLFGREVTEDKKTFMERPRDPMAELLLVPGDPAKLARMCDQRARMRELLAALCIAGSFASNGVLAFFLLALLVR